MVHEKTNDKKNKRKIKLLISMLLLKIRLYFFLELNDLQVKYTFVHFLHDFKDGLVQEADSNHTEY